MIVCGRAFCRRGFDAVFFIFFDSGGGFFRPRPLLMVDCAVFFIFFFAFLSVFGTMGGVLIA